MASLRQQIADLYRQLCPNPTHITGDENIAHFPWSLLSMIDAIDSVAPSQTLLVYFGNQLNNQCQNRRVLFSESLNHILDGGNLEESLRDPSISGRGRILLQDVQSRLG